MVQVTSLIIGRTALLMIGRTALLIIGRTAQFAIEVSALLADYVETNSRTLDLLQLGCVMTDSRNHNVST